MSDIKSKKSKSENSEEIIEETASNSGPQDTVLDADLVSREELDALKLQLEETETKAAEYLDGWQRAQAEFSNYKKRLEREQSAMYLSLKAEIIKRYLPVLDDMERALQNRIEDASAASWVNGVELIYRKLLSVLDAEGVKRIEAEGQMFDPNFHEAIMQEPSPDHESGQVTAVIQHGYMLGDRVIRHALVRVAQ